MGIILMIAGVTYLADTLGKLLLPNYQVSEGYLTFILVPASIDGELWLAVWLIMKGVATGPEHGSHLQVIYQKCWRRMVPYGWATFHGL